MTLPLYPSEAMHDAGDAADICLMLHGLQKAILRDDSMEGATIEPVLLDDERQELVLSALGGEEDTGSSLVSTSMEMQDLIETLYEDLCERIGLGTASVSLDRMNAVVADRAGPDCDDRLLMVGDPESADLSIILGRHGVGAALKRRLEATDIYNEHEVADFLPALALLAQGEMYQRDSIQRVETADCDETRAFFDLYSAEEGGEDIPVLETYRAPSGRVALIVATFSRFGEALPTRRILDACFPLDACLAQVA